MAKLRKTFFEGGGRGCTCIEAQFLRMLKNRSYILTLLTILILLRNFLYITQPVF